MIYHSAAEQPVTERKFWCVNKSLENTSVWYNEGYWRLLFNSVMELQGGYYLKAQ